MPTIPQMKSLEIDCSAVGFDICHSFHPSLYNEHIAKHDLPLNPLPSEETSIGYLIGNTKLLWPIFIKWYNSSKNKIDNPLDTYCQTKIEDILSAHFPSSFSYQVYWSSESSADKLVSMQRAASSSGLSYLDSRSHLTIHPVYGTWHSFRAVVVVTSKDTTIFGSRSINISIPALPSFLLTPQEEQEAQLALFQALQLSDQNRLCEQLHGKGPSEQVAAAWIAVRDCISRGKEYRFDHNQLWYHYTKDTKFLRE